MTKTIAVHGQPLTPGLVNALINGKCVKSPAEDGEFESPSFDQLRDSNWLTRAVLQELYQSLGLNPGDHAGDPLDGAAIAAFIRLLGANPAERGHYVSVLRGFIDAFGGDPVSGIALVESACKSYSDTLAVSIRSDLSDVGIVASSSYSFLQSHLQTSAAGKIVNSLPVNFHDVFGMNLPLGTWVVDGSFRYSIPADGSLSDVSAALALDGVQISDSLWHPIISPGSTGNIIFPRQLVSQPNPIDKRLSIIVSMNGSPGVGITTRCHLFSNKVPT